MFVRDDLAADSDTLIYLPAQKSHGAMALKILDVGPWNWRPM